jgi:ATP-dependent exoDNAse (exonuclease V) beta subunit
VNWQVEQGCLAVLTSPRRPDESIDDFVYRVLHVDQEHNQERDLAADEGTNIHNAIQLSLEGLEYDPKYRPHVEAVRREIDPLGYVVMTEKVVVGEGYAGRTDAVLENPEMITVLDFKGCNKLPDKPYDEHRMQMAAYSAALGNTGEKRVQCANVYINRNVPGEVKLCVIDDWQKEYEKFKLLVRYWYLANNVPMPEGML